MAQYSLYGKTAVVTGASGGFGSEITKILIKKYGCNVIGVGRTREKLERTANSLGKFKKHFRYFLFDVSDKSAWRKFARTLEKRGVIPDICINNAGMMPPFKSFDAVGSEGVLRVLEVNFLSVVYSAEYIIPLLLKSPEGAFVNVASSAAFSPLAGCAAYCSAKAANKNFTMSLAQEYKGRLYISSVCPGVSDTELFRESSINETEARVMHTFGTDSKRVAKSILSGMEKGNELIIIGKDARLMTAMSCTLPRVSQTVYGKVITQVDTPVFSGVHRGKEGK